jgi:hypothetical protein
MAPGVLPQGSDRYVEVASFGGLALAHVLRDALSSTGIRSFLSNGGTVVFKAICSLASLSLCLSLSGCGGLVGVAGRAAGTGNEYASWKSAVPNIQPGTGRLFVYIPKLNIFGAAGGTQIFGVDKDVCGVLGGAFMYVDLPVGDHEVSTNDMQMLFGRFRRGKYGVKIKIPDGSATYLRFDAATEDNGGAPRVVDAASAEAEMSTLPLDTHFVSFECKKDAAQDRGT